MIQDSAFYEILRSALKTVDPFPKNYTTEVMLGNLVSTYTRFSNNWPSMTLMSYKKVNINTVVQYAFSIKCVQLKVYYKSFTLYILPFLKACQPVLCPGLSMCSKVRLKKPNKLTVNCCCYTYLSTMELHPPFNLVTTL